MEKPNYKRPRRPYGSDIPANKLQFYIPDPKVAAKCFRANADPRSKFLPPVVDGIRVHVGVAQNIRPGGKLYVAPRASPFIKSKHLPFFASPSPDWFKAAFLAAGLRLDEMVAVGGFFPDLLVLLAEAVERLDAAGRQPHPLAHLLRQGRHYPYANWLAHDDQLLGSEPEATAYCAVGCNAAVPDGGGD